MAGVMKQEHRIIERMHRVTGFAFDGGDRRVAARLEVTVEVDPVGAVGGDGEEEVCGPEGGDKGIAHAGAAAVGDGVEFGEPIAHAGGLRGGEVFVDHGDVLRHGGREQEIFDAGEIGRLGIGGATRECIQMGRADLKLTFESSDGVFEPMVGATSGGRTGEDDARIAGADDLDGRGGLGEISRAVVPLLSEVVVGIKIGFIAQFDGQDRGTADLKRIGGFLGGRVGLVASEVDAMEAFPLRGFQEAVKVVQRGAADHRQSSCLIQARRSVRLPAREFDFVAAEAQGARTKIAVEIDEYGVLRLEVRLDERVLLIADT